MMGQTLERFAKYGFSVLDIRSNILKYICIVLSVDKSINHFNFKMHYNC